MAEKKKQESQESRENRGYVRYIGTSDVRQITDEDFADIGIKQKSLVWSKANNWLVPRAEISDAAYETAIMPDLELVLMDSEGERIPPE